MSHQIITGNICETQSHQFTVRLARIGFMNEFMKRGQATELCTKILKRGCRKMAAGALETNKSKC